MKLERGDLLVLDRCCVLELERDMLLELERDRLLDLERNWLLELRVKDGEWRYRMRNKQITVGCNQTDCQEEEG